MIRSRSDVPVPNHPSVNSFVFLVAPGVQMAVRGATDRSIAVREFVDERIYWHLSAKERRKIALVSF